MEIRIAKPDELEIIHQLAHEIWWPTYQGIISDEQISFMLKDMYSLHSLQRQIEREAIFILAKEDEHFVGFASCSFSQDNAVCTVHKLYILPSQQGKGIGRNLIHFITREASERGAETIELNVNRNNPALQFYLKEGFTIYKEVDISYFDYVLNDYVLRRSMT